MHQFEIRSNARQSGFTYLSLLILVAIIGLASATALQAGSALQRRAAEEELLAIGAEFQQALTSYANATPAGKKRAPDSLQDLLKDPRYPQIRRHLRKVYADPITGGQEWGIVAAPDSGIAGFYSRSEKTPIKIGNFDVAFAAFEGKTSYRDWQFIGLPPAR